MRHQRSGRRYRVNHPLLDHLADDQVHLTDRHRAADGQKTLAVFVVHH